MMYLDLAELERVFRGRWLWSCCRLLPDDDQALIQAITIADSEYDQHRKSVNFIKRHVFPGSNLPCVAAMAQSVARATDFRIVHLEEIAAHHARTLAAWRQRLEGSRPAILARGYSEELIRAWAVAVPTLVALASAVLAQSARPRPLEPVAGEGQAP